jgi:PAS domain S-box-containing protein
LLSHQGIVDGDGVHAGLGRTPISSCAHTVHFYESEPLFLDSLGEFVGGALGAGGVCVIVATASRFQGLSERLRGLGIDLLLAGATNRYFALDTEETLTRFMVRGSPDQRLFKKTLEPVLLRARSGLRRPGSPIVVFGEMASVLCDQGKYQAALHLEELWNELACRYDISLRCAYPVRLFANEEQRSNYHRICAEHTEVIPAESLTSLKISDSWRVVSSLQQQASTLQAALELHQREIEQRIRVEEKLRQTEEFANTIVESSADCVKVLGLDGRLQFINVPGCQAMEIDEPRQVLGRNWIDFWSEEDRPRAEAAVTAALAGSVGSFQAEGQTFSGKPKCWDVKITPARAANGRIERLIAVSRDITELRNAQLAAIHAEKLATAGRMAATIAHEINNPLEAVTNFIYLAQTCEGIPDEVRCYLEIADRELTRVAHIARQTLGFYRSTSTLRLMPVSDLVRDALMIYERRLRNKELQVEVLVPPALTVYGKDGELRQALLNLVANAIDACPSGGKIWFRAQKTKNWTNRLEEGIRISLADNGVGMSPEVQRHVFAPFFTTKAEVGTGIGLWVTKCLIEQRGGYVHFRSRQGERSGTIMSLFLPNARPADFDTRATAA